MQQLLPEQRWFHELEGTVADTGSREADTVGIRIKREMFIEGKRIFKLESEHNDLHQFFHSLQQANFKKIAALDSVQRMINLDCNLSTEALHSVMGMSHSGD
jgi:hypothetical protein